MLVRWAAAAVALIAVAAPSRAEPLPVCPSRGIEPNPPYGDVGAPPSVATWRDIGPASGARCANLPREPAALVVALAGRFRHAGSRDDLAARVGAISAMAGLPYWSVTERRWRVLVSDAFALAGPDRGTARTDFSAEEILSGRALYLAQDDTRSTGLNVYRLTGASTGRDRLSFEIVNTTSVRFSFLTLFEPASLRSVHFLEREGRGVWRYYGLSLVTGGTLDGQERSFVNRHAAFYRFLIGEPPDREPPLAP